MISKKEDKTKNESTPEVYGLFLTTKGMAHDT